MSDQRTREDWRPLGEDRESGNGTVLPGAAAAASGTFEMLTGLPRLLGGALEDLRSIARGMQYLPELARLLAEIDRGVASLEEEVRVMRKAVESMGGDVGDLSPKLDDLQRSIPLNRLRRRS